ncbi:zinc finger CCCH domain-containing protein 3 [Arapaima gigas]
MEERESLTRQIELLQKLINTHKSIHGDVPSDPRIWHGPAPDRGRGVPFSKSFQSRSGVYSRQPVGHWRKKYSLSNRSTGHPSSTVSAPTSSVSRECPLEAPRTSTKQQLMWSSLADPLGSTHQLGSSSLVQKDESPGIVTTGITGKTESKITGSVTQASSSTMEAGIRTREGNRAVGGSTSDVQQPRTNAGNRVNPAGPGSCLHPASRKATAGTFPTTPFSRPPLGKRDSSVKLQETAMAPGQITSSPSPSLPAPQKRSQFTWVKGSMPQPATSSLKDTGSGPLAPERKVPRKPVLSLPPPQVIGTTRYKWVSSTASRHARLPRRSCSPKMQDAAHKKVKTRRGTVTSPSSQSSRYRWKASGVTAKAAALGSSVYHWTSEKEKSQKGTLSPRLNPTATDFKLKSRMKIIRGKPSSSPNSGSERRPGFGSVTVSNCYSLRRRSQPMGRKAQARGLISIGRHKLRRLSSASPPGTSRAGPSSVLLRSTTAQRVIRTRYKIVTRRGIPGPFTPTFSSTSLSWRARKVQSARILLQNRLRSPPGATHHGAVLSPPWRVRNIRWIGGALYRVSANKLYRTASLSTTSSAAARLRTGRCSTPQDIAAHKASSTRHLASRAVQRSRSIIRHALQRRQHSRQYCMYYNRFGRCNRSQNCPYIHDPDKVAVCTRFLRGTCKQTDGTCPFSHKVSKEKMPVCSYFLRGVCSNSSCPYSHVYVSRKAAICEDFVRGYCPQGEKCKKKHTLLCPDFSSATGCPRGSRCQLQHRARAKRAAPNHSSRPAKRAHKRNSPERQESSESSTAQDRTLPGTSRLPSFISLCSSPETAEAPDTPPAEGSLVTEKKLHIKPRF